MIPVMDLYRQQIQCERYLLTLYKLANGDTHEAIFTEDMNLGMEEEEADKVSHYLEEEQLISFPTYGTVALTHRAEKRQSAYTLCHIAKLKDACCG
jgi:hypothetical protein